MANLQGLFPWFQMGTASPASQIHLKFVEAGGGEGWNVKHILDVEDAAVILHFAKPLKQ